MTINTIPRRDAHATFAGFVLQANVTILRWLELGPADRLELEAGEDIDLVQGASEQGDKEKRRVMEQLKQKGCNITLRSPIASRQSPTTAVIWRPTQVHLSDSASSLPLRLPRSGPRG
jgi:hypothetical protein